MDSETAAARRADGRTDDSGPADEDRGWSRALDLLAGRRVVVLSGAGCSTDSGIPDYRGEGTRRRARRPVQYRQFVGSDVARRRYWARSMVGWPKMAACRPNPGHRAIARLEAEGRVTGVITQNVDRLHQAAGSQRVVELHGALAEVTCLACGAYEARSSLQDRLLTLNPTWLDQAFEVAPDGDADLEQAALARFRVAPCRACGGALKPNVVFFGENVPRARSEAAWALWDRAEVLLVVGTSLAVLSGYRFVRKAAARNLPVLIVNRGPTRGDAEATVRIDAPLGTALPSIAEALLRAPRIAP